jgi:hypothetical protein
MFVSDNNENRPSPWRVSSGHFEDSSDGTPLSMLLAELDTPERALAAHPGVFLAGMLVQLARDASQGIHPRGTDADPSHCFVFGPKSPALRRKLAKACTWVVEPPPPSD